MPGGTWARMASDTRPSIPFSLARVLNAHPVEQAAAVDAGNLLHARRGLRVLVAVAGFAADLTSRHIGSGEEPFCTSLAGGEVGFVDSG